VTPSASATACSSSPGSRTVASSTSQTPSQKRSCASRAAASAHRDFPTPAGPVTVTSRDLSKCRFSERTSAVRPTNVVSSAGRLPGGVEP
jgi:hypothetical protein